MSETIDMEKVQEISVLRNWSSVELEHAIANLDTTYEKESVIRLANGRELCSPAYPECCSYVRLVQDGYELAYWNSDEWTEDSECVMGAIFGAAKGSN
jgi:hypothetical protein